MPRPTSDDPRTEHVRCRLTPGELERIERRAAAAGHPTVSAFIRARCLTDPPDRRARLPDPPPSPAKLAAVPTPAPGDLAAFQLAEQIRRAGLTVNQCNRHLNEGRLLRPGMEQELADTLAALRTYLRRALDL